MFRQLAPGVLVSGQIFEADLAKARDLGVTLIINNRPDGEEPGQPDAASMARAAQALELDYLYAPMRGMPNAETIEVVESALRDGTPILMHCKSGMRSTVAWAIAASRTGQPRDEIVSAAADAGYDLSSMPF